MISRPPYVHSRPKTPLFAADLPPAGVPTGTSAKATMESPNVTSALHPDVDARDFPPSYTWVSQSALTYCPLSSRRQAARVSHVADPPVSEYHCLHHRPNPLVDFVDPASVPRFQTTYQASIAAITAATASPATVKAGTPPTPPPATSTESRSSGGAAAASAAPATASHPGTPCGSVVSRASTAGSRRSAAGSRPARPSTAPASVADIARGVGSARAQPRQVSTPADALQVAAEARVAKALASAVSELAAAQADTAPLAAGARPSHRRPRRRRLVKPEAAAEPPTPPPANVRCETCCLRARRTKAAVAVAAPPAAGSPAKTVQPAEPPAAPDAEAGAAANPPGASHAEATTAPASPAAPPANPGAPGLHADDPAPKPTGAAAAVDAAASPTVAPAVATATQTEGAGSGPASGSPRSDLKLALAAPKSSAATDSTRPAPSTRAPTPAVPARVATAPAAMASTAATAATSAGAPDDSGPPYETLEDAEAAVGKAIEAALAQVARPESELSATLVHRAWQEAVGVVHPVAEPPATAAASKATTLRPQASLEPTTRPRRRVQRAGPQAVRSPHVSTRHNQQFHHAERVQPVPQPHREYGKAFTASYTAPTQAGYNPILSAPRYPPKAYRLRGDTTYGAAYNR